MTNDLEAIQTWLQSSYSVVAPPDWLTACVEWIQQEHGGQPLSVAQLQPMVFEQWLMSDLKELGAACLPDDLPSQLSTFINGPLALQVESMLDVGVPLYGQLQKVKGTLNANSEVSAERPQQPAWEPKPSRMMLLKMTDGQTFVQGMEYQPIPAFNPDLQPGFKVVIHGQVKCRRGVLMLTADNVQVLGGEVDSLIETNTPVAVLEQAMELGRTNNGKHERKEFSGRFLKKQDFKQDCKGPQEKKFKTEVMSSIQRPASVRGGYGPSVRADGGGVKIEPLSQPHALNSGAVKQEPPSQPHIMNHDDEWEEDLDYGGLLDEPMEEELTNQPSVSQPSPTVASTAQQAVGPHRKNPFACPPNAVTTNSNTSWQSGVSVNSGWSTSTKPASSFGGSEMSGDSESSETADILRDERQRAKQAAMLQTHSANVEDDMWDDDDDFDMVQVETDVLSPVIPVQIPVGPNRQNIKNVNNNTVMVKQATAQKSQSSSLANTTTSNIFSNFSSSGLKTGVNSTSESSSIPQNNSKSFFPSKPQKSCSETKPPPAKQRKLTAMFSRTNSDSTLAISCTQTQTLPDSVGDLTDDGAVSVTSHTSSGDSGGTLTEAGNIRQERNNDLTDSTLCRPAENTLVQSESKEYHDEGMTDENENKDNHQTTCGNQDQNETIPRAVIPPLNSQGEPVASCPEPQTLKSVQSLLQSSSDADTTYTIKGYITTLTDKLRSCQGNRWSLSCRITDGTATMEVAIADMVLAQLIGFTAKESIILRQQARKDASVKDFLTQGLQKCQKSLIEFSGLMDLQGQEGDKPSLVNMLQLEVKKR